MTYIAIEGVDGAGKTSLVNELESRLAERCLIIRQPSDSPYGREIRGIISESCDDSFDVHMKLALLFALDRLLLKPVIEAALDEGLIVITDRDVWSSYVYQFMVQDYVPALNRGAARPSFTFLLTAPVETLCARLAQRGKLNVFDDDAVEVIKGRQEHYRSLCKDWSRFAIELDATCSTEDLVEQVLSELSLA